MATGPEGAEEEESVRLRAIEVGPQDEVAVTEIVPLVEELGVIVIELVVEAPDHPVGSVQLYVVPDTLVTL